MGYKRKNEELQIEQRLDKLNSELTLKGERINVLSEDLADITQQIESGQLGGTVTDAQLDGAIQRKIDDGSMSALAVTERSITPGKTTFIKFKIINMFDKTKAVQGYVNGTGGIANSTSYYTSDYIPVEEGKTYKTNANGNSGYYDANKVFVQTLSGFNGNVVVPTGLGIAYVRIAFHATAQYPTGMFVEGSVLPSSYIEYGVGNLYWDSEAYKTDMAKEVISTQNFTDAVKNLVKDAQLQGLKWNAMGDSITYGLNATKPYHKVIADRTGIVVTNYGASGTLIAATSGRTDSMCERYSNMVDDADIITIFGGTNDFGNTVPLGVWGDTVNTTLYGAMKILVEGLLTKYPGKRIGFILPIPRASQTSPTSGLKNYINVIKDVCDRYSVPTLDLYTQSGLAPDFAANKSVTIPDGLHPSDAGHLLISYKIEAFIRRL